MVDYEWFKALHQEGVISDGSFGKIEAEHQHPLFSLHWEIKTLLYLGVVLLTSGLGILVYKNIGSIGHQAVLAFIALVSIGCFVYCFKRVRPFSIRMMQAPNSFFDYILLLGTISFLIFVGYLQYQYMVFGTHYGMATFIPMLVLFYIAYRFDHIGILTLAITNLGIWMGVSVTLKQLLADDTFNSQAIIYTYLAFGLLLLAFAWVTQKDGFKAHFKFSYQHYGVHVSFIALLAGYFYNYNETASMLWLLAVPGLAAYVVMDATKNKSFYFLLLAVLYSYMAVSCLVSRGLLAIHDIGATYFLFMYFIGSSIVLIYYLIHLNKKLKSA